MKRSKRQSKASGQTTNKNQTDLSATAPPITIRFSATIQPGKQIKGKDWMNRLDVDRLPSTKNEVRALLSPEDLHRLLEQGFEVHLQKSYPVRPLDPALIMSDEAFKASLDHQVKSIKPPKR